MMWKELVETYYEAWTASRTTPAEACVACVRRWLNDSNIWTETDRRILDKMSRDDINRLSADIVNRVREDLGETLAEEMERAKAYHETMQYLYDLAEKTNNDDIYEAYHLMAKTEGDLFSPAVYYDPAVVRPEDDPSDLEPWVFRMEQWHDIEGRFAVAYTDDHVLLLDDRGTLGCFTDDSFTPEAMMWEMSPSDIPSHLLPLYKMMEEAREVR